jgi:hypothetical protein
MFGGISGHPNSGEGLLLACGWEEASDAATSHSAQDSSETKNYPPPKTSSADIKDLWPKGSLGTVTSRMPGNNRQLATDKTPLF